MLGTQEKIKININNDFGSPVPKRPVKPYGLPLIANHDLYTHVKSTILQLYQCRADETRSPVANPSSLSRCDFHWFYEHRYFVSEKTQGVRMLLLLTQIGQREYAVMVDRAWNMIQIEVCADASYFKNTLLDGEMVWNNDDRGWYPAYLVFDIVALFNSTAIAKRVYSERLTTIENCLDIDNEQRIRFIDPLMRIEKKIVFPLTSFYLLLGHLPRVNHACDGIIFTPDDEPVGRGLSKNVFKFKDVHTIDVMVELSADPNAVFIETLYAADEKNENIIILWSAPLMWNQPRFEISDNNNNNTHISVQFELNVNNDLSEKLLTFLNDNEKKNQLFFADNNNVKKTFIGEFTISSCDSDVEKHKNIQCFLTDIRLDKDRANAIRTICRTVNNVIENINVFDLIELSKKISYISEKN